MKGDLKKIGRPTEHPKNFLVKFRCDKELNAQLEYCCMELSMSKSEILRSSIEKLYKVLNNKDN